MPLYKEAKEAAEASSWYFRGIYETIERDYEDMIADYDQKILIIRIRAALYFVGSAGMIILGIVNIKKATRLKKE